jgi:isopenicillin-N N-acyltransferase like protein
MLRTLALLLLLPAVALAQPKHVFKEGKHEAGELKIVNGLPVCVVAGTPKQMGEQLGVLVGKNSPNPTPVLQEFLAAVKLKEAFPALKKVAGNLKANFPEAYTTEMAEFAKGADYELDMLYFVNSVYDLSSSMGCATVVVEKERSKTGSPVFGRNFDWVPSKGLLEQTLILVMKPEKKHAFASITFSPITGVISGMNDAGLCLTINQINLSQSKDKAKFNWKGTPMLLIFRQILEDCTTVAEAEKFLKDAKPMTTASLTVCDASGGCVFEISPKAIEVRKPTNGITLCTNKFLSEKLDGDTRACARLEKLLKTQEADAKLDADDVFAKLHEVNQDIRTMQTMVFDPAGKVLHLKLSSGKESASVLKPIQLELAPLFGGK